MNRITNQKINLFHSILMNAHLISTLTVTAI